MTKIYEQHDAAFKNVSAYVVMKDGQRVATIAFKFPEDGAGRLYAYVHWIGVEMVRGHANGYGYDKRSAACESAVKNMAAVFADFLELHKPYMMNPSLRCYHDGLGFREVLRDIGGSDWQRKLEDAGFTVLQAV